MSIRHFFEPLMDSSTLDMRKYVRLFFWQVSV
jgi:hypothetical protein